MAAELKQALGVDATLEVGSSGEFTVWLGADKVAEKKWGRAIRATTNRTATNTTMVTVIALIVRRSSRPASTPTASAKTA